MSREEVVRLILAELDRAEIIHDWPDDVIHQAAVVNEESGELIQAALDYTYADAPASRMVEEATQVGAMAVRFLVNIMSKEAA